MILKFTDYNSGKVTFAEMTKLVEASDGKALIETPVGETLTLANEFSVAEAAVDAALVFVRGTRDHVLGETDLVVAIAPSIAPAE